MNMTRYYLVRGCILAALLLGLLWAIHHKKNIEAGISEIPTELPKAKSIQYEGD